MIKIHVVIAKEVTGSIQIHFRETGANGFCIQFGSPHKKVNKQMVIKYLLEKMVYYELAIGRYCK